MTTPIKPYKRDKNPDTPSVTAKYYITNGKMLPEVIKSKEQGKISDELARMLMMLTRKYAQRPCFSNYTYKEDMISEALANLCQNALKFKPEKSSNPFAFYTSCINNSFLQFLNVEKKHRRIRDQLLIDMGENPSFNFQEEAKNHQGGEFQEDFAELKTNIEEAKIRMDQDAVHAAAKAAAIAAIVEKMLVEEAEGKMDPDQPLIDPDDVGNAEIIPNISLLDFEGNLDEDKNRVI
jgi:DNA-directed RNA polymerase specialized sigma24 family protein